MDNVTIAQRLTQYASEMDRVGGLFRARSYRAAAFAITRLQRPLHVIFQEGGRPALEAIPGIGLSMGYTIEVLLTTGEFRVLRDPPGSRRALITLPGIGPRLAESLRDRLGIISLEGLRQAAQSGKLARYVSPPQLRGIQAAVEARLREESAPQVVNEPSIEDLLAADTAYRTEGASHTCRAGWRLRASPANTSLAHRLGKTGDWVEIEFERADVIGHRTVVTAENGRRLVRGREKECQAMRDGASAA